MSRIEQIRNRLDSAAPIETPGTWYHEDVPYLIAENEKLQKQLFDYNHMCKVLDGQQNQNQRLRKQIDRLRAERDAAAKLLTWVDSEFGNYMPAVYHDKFVEWRGKPKDGEGEG